MPSNMRVTNPGTLPYALAPIKVAVGVARPFVPAYPDALFYDDFSSGDLANHNDYFRWSGAGIPAPGTGADTPGASGPVVVDTVGPDGTTIKALAFEYLGSSKTSERRWSLTSSKGEVRTTNGPSPTCHQEIWLSFDWFVSPSYAHYQRVDVPLTIVPAAPDWNVGDVVVGGDGISTAEIYQISGNALQLLKVRGAAHNPVWGGGRTITNQVTGAVAESTNRDAKSDNNKYLSLAWKGHYGHSAKEADAWASTEGYSDVETGCTTARLLWLNKNRSGNSPSTTTPTYVVPDRSAGSGRGFLVAPSDFGRWARRTIGYRCASPGASDGFMRHYVDGELILAQENMSIGNIDPALNGFDRGYLMGWHNSTYAEQAVFYVANFAIGLTPESVGLEV